MRKIKFDKHTVAFIVLAAFLLLELFLILPWSINRIIGLNKDISKLRLNLETIEKEWPRKDDYALRKLKLEEAILDLRTKFVNPEEQSKLLSFISGNSKDFGVEIKAMSPGALEDYSGREIGEFQYFPVRIRARSRFHNLAQFYEYLQNSQYFFEVKDFSLLYDRPYNLVEMTLCGLLRKR